MNKPINLCIGILICTFLIGCVSSGNKQASSTFYKKATTLESQNDFVEANENYQLAYAADPSNADARQQLTKINTQLQYRANQYYQKSLLLHKKGKYSEATRYLLIALRLWPEHVKARNALIAYQELNIQRYVWHTIQKGESLSKVSKIFYGDFDQAGIIAQANNIKDAGRIKVGMKLKIPELTDRPFINKGKIVHQEDVTDNLENLTETDVEPEEKIDPLAMYKSLGMEFFNNSQYDNAIIEFKKVLSSAPGDRDSMSYVSKAHYQLGSNAASQKNYLTAIEHYQNALSFNKNCPTCKKDITQSRKIYKELHYKAGMKYFDEQNLNKAVSEWELVQKMDPGYKKVAELLNKAKTIQKNIDVIKKSE